MRIVFDNIIFSLQKAGGISKYWSEIIKRLDLKDNNKLFYEHENDSYLYAGVTSIHNVYNEWVFYLVI